MPLRSLPVASLFSILDCRGQVNGWTQATCSASTTVAARGTVRDLAKDSRCGRADPQAALEVGSEASGELTSGDGSPYGREVSVMEWNERGLAKILFLRWPYSSAFDRELFELAR